MLFLGTDDMWDDGKPIRQSIIMDEPAPVKKYLGYTHNVHKETLKDGSVLAKCEFDMCDALAAAIKLYVSITGQRLKMADSPSPPDLREKELARLFEQEGSAGEHSVSFLMKLLCSARMTVLWISVAIQRLATQITKWSAEADRRLHKFFITLVATPNWS